MLNSGDVTFSEGRSGNLGRRREMARQVSNQNITDMRAVVGPGPSEMDLIRALHLARNDVAAAINILFDTPKSSYLKPAPRTTASPKAGGGSSSQVRPKEERQSPALPHTNLPSPNQTTKPRSPAKRPSSIPTPPRVYPAPNRMSPANYQTKRELESDCRSTESTGQSPAKNSLGGGDDMPEVVSRFVPPAPTYRRVEMVPQVKRPLETASQGAQVNAGPGATHELPTPLSALKPYHQSKSTIQSIHSALPSILDEDWVLLGEAEIIGYSTCKGPKLQSGDALEFVFPKAVGVSSKGLEPRRGPWGRGKGAAAAAEIVRFSCQRSGEVGRIPGDWARSLIPLIQTGKVRVEGKCRTAPASLALMDSIIVDFKVLVSRSMFAKFNNSTSALTASSEGTTNQPLPTLLRLLNREPFTKAAFTPEDLYSRKRTLDREVGQGSGSAVKKLKLVSAQALTTGAGAEGAEEEVSVLDDEDVNKLVGTSDTCKLEEMEPPSSMQCELRPYQKQALHWMTQLENGAASEDASRTLHPCWEAYHLAEEETVFYLNVFSGEASLEFPSALTAARGGILADAMGLGKTVMTISLIVSNAGRGGVALPGVVETGYGNPGTNNTAERTKSQPSTQMRELKWKHSSAQKGGGTLIVCPMTLLGQWKTEFEAHVTPGLLSVYAYYGNDRIRERKALLEHDIVLTTYGVLASEWSQPNFLEDGPLHSIHWFRVVLDEAHTIKASRCNSSQAVFQLTADRRWCLTGTPIQNKLEDVFSLLHFLRIEPWSNFNWWNKLVQKPFEEGDDRGLKLLQAILQPLMLRRTKDSVDKDGRPILVLPAADMQVVECHLTEAEQDFYQALFKKSKTKFDQFVEQGKVLHNYASILELLLRLRQCCDHPFLVLSRGDTAEYADLNKLANRFLKGGQGPANRPTEAFVQEVVKDLKDGGKAECPICLESAGDAVLTPCAHCMCRECLFASWRTYGGGPCPICRQNLTRQDIITAPSDSRFQVDVEANWTESSKVTALLKELEALRTSGSKSIVFSQWTAFLDLLEIPLKRKKFRFVRLDGTLSQQQREKVLKDFNDKPEILVFERFVDDDEGLSCFITLVMLISLKAGGVGINLTAANNAFLLDPWWNPAVEEQAIMRIHRIGQTKDVSIKRFIVKGSVEEKMQQVQARKQRMIAGALNNQEVRSARIEELKMLFC